MLGASFDTVDEQKTFATEQEFPYRLLSDPSREVGRAFDAEREEGEDYYEMGLPRRISYLIDPQGIVVKNYDLTGQDLSAHAGQILADIAEASG